MKRRSFIQLAAGAALVTGVAPLAYPARAASKTIVYLTPGLDLPFWRYLSKGVESAAKAKGYDFLALTPTTTRRPSSRTPRTPSPRALLAS